jgi:hypothetical protein
MAYQRHRAIQNAQQNAYFIDNSSRIRKKFEEDPSDSVRGAEMMASKLQKIQEREREEEDEREARVSLAGRQFDLGGKRKTRRKLRRRKTRVHKKR